MIEEIIRNVLCLLGFHEWRYDIGAYYETSTGIQIAMERKCIHCGKMEFRQGNWGE